MTDSLTSLVERLEKVEEGSRELDAEIAVAVFQRISTDDDLIYARPTRPEDDCAVGTYWRKSRSGLSLLIAPYFTSSIDVALTLLPAGAEYTISTLYGIAYVELPLNFGDQLPEQVRRIDGNVVLTFVTACLRARQQGEG